MLQVDNFIAGEFQQSADYLDLLNPATGKKYGLVADSTDSNLEQALSGARQAFPAWSRLKADVRADYLLKIAVKMQASSEDFALAEVNDTGKPISLARNIDIPRAIANFKFFATAISQFASQAYDMGSQGFNYTLYQPLGIVACITPWNLPLYLLTWKIAPAIAAGNCIIAKPSELAPATAGMLAKICAEVLPHGVVNILHGQGQGIGEAICRHPEIRAVSFTGGTKSGVRVAEVCAKTLKKTALELGGKNPAIVLADCDLEATVNGLLRATFNNQGEVCHCSSRIYVEASLYPEFRDLFAAKVSQLKLGDPLTEGVDLGALISADHLAKVTSYLNLADETAGEFILRGGRAEIPGRCQNGFFMQPTVFAPENLNCRLNTEEIFGPFTTIQAFNTLDEVVDLANSGTYDLSATIWGRDLKRCHYLAGAINAGTVWLNSWMLRDLRTPLGAYKESGLAKEGGVFALEFFSAHKNICVAY